MIKNPAYLGPNQMRNEAINALRSSNLYFVNQEDLALAQDIQILLGHTV